MERLPISKKAIFAVLLSSSIVIAGAGMSLGYPGSGMGPPAQQGKNMSQPNPETLQAKEKFLDESVSLRKELAQKHAAMRAMMRSGNPDPKTTANLAGEIFDLREKLRTKAKESGLKGSPFLGVLGFGPHECHSMGAHGRFINHP